MKPRDIRPLLNSLDESCYQELLFLMLSRLDPAYLVSHRILLDALTQFFSRASRPQLVELLPESIVRYRMDTSHYKTNTRVSSAQHRSPSFPPQIIRARSASIRMPNFSTTPDNSIHSRSSSISSNSSSAESRSRLGSKIMDHTPTSSSPRSESPYSIAEPRLSPVSRRENKKSIDDHRRESVSYRTLVRIIKALPNRDHHIPEDIRSDPQRLWKDERSFLESSDGETDAIRRHRLLRDGEKRNTNDKMLARSRDRMFKILRGNEQEILLSQCRQAAGDTVQVDIDRVLCRQLTVSIRELRSLRTLWTRYISLMRDFGPGSVLVLSGSHTDWLRLPEEDFTIFTAYVRLYRPEWVALAKSCNLVAAAGLAHGLIRVGMHPHALPNTHSTLISILMEYVQIGEGGILPCNETDDEEDPSPAVPRSIVEAAQRLHQMVGHWGRCSPDLASDCSTSPGEGCTGSLVEIRDEAGEAESRPQLGEALELVPSPHSSSTPKSNKRKHLLDSEEERTKRLRQDDTLTHALTVSSSDDHYSNDSNGGNLDFLREKDRIENLTHDFFAKYLPH